VRVKVHAKVYVATLFALCRVRSLAYLKRLAIPSVGCVRIAENTGLVVPPDELSVHL
jgi:hypothetical protein